jgi:hypothetical protein
MIRKTAQLVMAIATFARGLLKDKHIQNLARFRRRENG